MVASKHLCSFGCRDVSSIEEKMIVSSEFPISCLSEGVSYVSSCDYKTLLGSIECPENDTYRWIGVTSGIKDGYEVSGRCMLLRDGIISVGEMSACDSGSKKFETLRLWSNSDVDSLEKQIGKSMEIGEKHYVISGSCEELPKGFTGISSNFYENALENIIPKGIRGNRILGSISGSHDEYSFLGDLYLFSCGVVKVGTACFYNYEYDNDLLSLVNLLKSSNLDIPSLDTSSLDILENGGDSYYAPTISLYASLDRIDELERLVTGKKLG